MTGDTDVDVNIYGETDLSQLINMSCDFIDLENYVCRYVEAGLTPGKYNDSLCSTCLMGLEFLRQQRM
ncbi:MAG: hypothetical protein V3T58_04535 [Candidatus Hydrothermarchaeales archaeon]